MKASELDALSLDELTDMHQSIFATKTPIGWDTENAATKSSIERLIFDRVVHGRDGDDSSIPCDIKVRVITSSGKKIESNSAEIRAGLLFVHASADLTADEPVDIQIRTENDYPLRVKCVTRSASGGDSGITVGFRAPMSEAAERRVHRLIFEILKHRTS